MSLQRLPLVLLALLVSAAAVGAATFTVRMIAPVKFSPNLQTISIGDTVTWTNADTIIHTTTSGTSTPDGLWDSPFMSARATYSVTFSGPAGDYPYFCRPHLSLGMTGKITVIAPNLPPSVSITNPMPGASFAVGTAIQIQADASDPDGTVTEVDFFANGQPIGSAVSPPFSITISALPPGNYALTAVATDNAGATTTSASVNITVLRGIIPPTVTITNPVNSQAFLAGTNILVEASASDSDGIVTQVEFFLNSVSVGVIAAPPYSIILSNLAIGDYVLSARTTDNDGATSASPAINFSVLTPPSAPTILVPPRSQTVTVGSNVNFSVSATGTEPLIYQWQFNGVALADQTQDSLLLTAARTNDGGAYAVVVANAAGAITSAPAILTVELPPDIPPTITLTNPPNDSRFPAGAIVAIFAAATDADGVVRRVEFFVRTNLTSTNSISIGVVTNPPFGITSAPLSPGTYVVTAVATDDRGGTGLSPENSFSVYRPPTIALTRDPTDTNLSVGTTITLTATTSTFGATVTNVEFFDGAIKLADANSAPFLFMWKPAQAGLHSVSAVATDELGQRGVSASETVRIFTPEQIPPKVAITNSPPNLARLTSPEIALSGIASDNIGLDRVEYQINDGPAVPAVGLQTWSFTAQLEGGFNTVHVRSIDLADNVSSDALRFYTYVVQSPLDILVLGNGRVTPNLGGKMLQVGKTYQITARPDAGHVFEGWSTNSISAVLRFRMTPGLRLVASFKPNPFPVVAGTYTGLFVNANEPGLDSSGMLSLQLGKQGAFSGKLMTAAGSYAFHGRFDAFGCAVVPVVRPGISPMALGLHLNLSGATNEVSGSVTNTVNGELTVADLLAYKNVFNARANHAPDVGEHPFAIARTAAEGGQTVGSGSATIYGIGSVRILGLLEQSNEFSLMSALSPELSSPLYVRFNGGRAALLGWLDLGSGSVNGSLLWLSGTSAPVVLEVTAPR